MKTLIQTMLFLLVFSFGHNSLNAQITTNIQSSSIQVVNVTQMAKAYFNEEVSLGNYTGVDFTDAGLQQLLTEAQKVKDSLDYDVFSIQFPLISSSVSTGLEDNYQRALSQITSSKYILFCFAFANTQTENIGEFFVEIKNDIELAEEQKGQLQNFIKNITQEHFNNHNQIKEQPASMAEGLKHFLGYNPNIQFPFYSENLPCYMPEDGYLITPHLVGIYVKAETEINFYPNVGTYDGRLLALKDDDQIKSQAFDGNSFLGYLRFTDPNDDYSLLPPDTVGHKYFLGIVEEWNEVCRCIIFPYYATFQVVNNGVNPDIPEFNGEFPASFPQSEEDYQTHNDAHPELGPIKLQAIDPSYCGRISGPNSLGNLSGSYQEIKSQLDSFFPQGSISEGCWLLFNESTGVLKQYSSAGTTPLSYSGIQATNIVNLYKNGVNPTGCEGYVVLIIHDGYSNLEFDISFKPGFLEVGQEYLDLEGHEPYNEDVAAEQLREIIRSKLQELETISDLALQSYNFQPYPEFSDDGQLIVKDARFTKWMKFFVDKTGYLIKNVELDPTLWNYDSLGYNDNLVNIFVPVAGISDQLLIEVKDMKEMVSMAGEFCSHPKESIENLYESVSKLDIDDVKKMVSSGIEQEIEALTTPGPKRQHKISKYTTQAAMVIFAWTKSGSKLMLEFTDDVSKSVDKIRDFVSNFTDDLGDAYQALSPNNKKKFFEDFENWTPDQAGFFNGSPEGVKAWDLMRQAGTDLRLNTTALGKIDFLKSKNLTDAQLIKIGQLDDIKAIDIADNLAKRTNPAVSQSVLDELDIIAQKAKGLEAHDPAVMDKIKSLTLNDNFVNPQDLRRFLNEGLTNANSTGSIGFRTELDDVIDGLNSGKKMHLSYRDPNYPNIDIDVYNETDNLIRECKAVSSGQFKSNGLGGIGTKYNSENALPGALRNQFDELHGTIDIKDGALLTQSESQILNHIKYYYSNDLPSGSPIKVGLDRLTNLKIKKNGVDFANFSPSNWQ